MDTDLTEANEGNEVAERLFEIERPAQKSCAANDCINGYQRRQQSGQTMKVFRAKKSRGATICPAQPRQEHQHSARKFDHEMCVVDQGWGSGDEIHPQRIEQSQRDNEDAGTQPYTQCSGAIWDRVHGVTIGVLGSIREEFLTPNGHEFLTAKYAEYPERI